MQMMFAKPPNLRSFSFLLPRFTRKSPFKFYAGHNY